MTVPPDIAGRSPLGPPSFALPDLSVPFHQEKPFKEPRQKKPPRVKTLPIELNGSSPESNDAFEEAVRDPIQSISPRTLGFMPSSYWLNTSISFGDLVHKFFHRKNNSSCRFPHKLFNALLLVEANPTLFSMIGVKWLTDSAFLVDKYVFGRLLGIVSFDGGLFHRQGNFPSHGFLEVLASEVAQIQSPGFDPSAIDSDRYRVLRHSSGGFTKGLTEDFFTYCKWTPI
jgi:hypothetical protein